METPDFQAWVGQEIHRRPARNKDRARADKLPRISAPVRAWAEGEAVRVALSWPLRPSQFRRITTADPRDAGRRRENIFDLPGTDRQYR